MERVSFSLMSSQNENGFTLFQPSYGSIDVFVLMYDFLQSEFKILVRKYQRERFTTSADRTRITDHCENEIYAVWLLQA